MNNQLKCMVRYGVLVSVSLTIVSALTACSTLKYQEPTSGERARVRFLNTSDAQAVLYTYPEVNCGGSEQEWLRLQNKFLFNASPKSLEMPLQDSNWHKNGFKELFVSAGKLNGLMMSVQAYYPQIGDNVNESEFAQLIQYSNPVYAGKTILYYQEVSQAKCGVPFEFNFENNKDYEISYTQNGLNCNITVYELSQVTSSPSSQSSTGGWQRIERAKFDNINQPPNNQCLPYFNKVRWS